MRGPPPKPTALKLLEGNPGKRPLNTNEPKAPAGRPPCPRWLSREGKRVWYRLARELETMGLLSTVDAEMLLLFCYSYSEFISCAKVVKERGRVFKTPEGHVAQRPEVSIGLRERQMMRAIAAEFGLTPAARSRLSIAGEPEEDAVEKLLRGN